MHDPAPQTTAPDRNIGLIVTIAAIVIAIFGIVLRIPGLFSDFWLDEIYSYISIRPLNSPIEIFTRFLNDNNHYLNSLFMYCIDDTTNWPLYRIPSLIAGVLTLPLVWLCSRKAGSAVAGIATILVSASYLLINFSSEARGYGLLIFFSAATWYLLQRCASEDGIRWKILLWIALCLGLLSHLTFIFVFAAALVWLPFDKAVKHEPWGAVGVQWLLCFAVPLAAAAAFYLAAVRFIAGGYGPGYHVFGVIAETLSYFGGEGQLLTPLTVAWGFISGGLMLLAIFLLWKKGRSEWLFFLVATLAAPAAALIIHRPGVLFVRYFLVSIFFGYLALSFLIADLLKRGRPTAIAATAFLLLFLAGNGFQVTRFIEYGRGSYLDALRFIEENSHEQTIGVSSDFEFRNEVIVEYYKQFLKSGKELLYVESYPGDLPPGWFILHAAGKPPEFKDRITDPYGNDFLLKKVFPCAGPSGFTWAIYRSSSQTF